MWYWLKQFFGSKKKAIDSESKKTKDQYVDDMHLYAHQTNMDTNPYDFNRHRSVKTPVQNIRRDDDDDTGSIVSTIIAAEVISEIFSSDSYSPDSSSFSDSSSSDSSFDFGGGDGGGGGAGGDW